MISLSQAVAGFGIFWLVGFLLGAFVQHRAHEARQQEQTPYDEKTEAEAKAQQEWERRLLGSRTMKLYVQEIEMLTRQLGLRFRYEQPVKTEGHLVLEKIPEGPTPTGVPPAGVQV